MAARWGIEHEGRRVDVLPEEPGKGYGVGLLVDGERVAGERSGDRTITVRHGGLEVRARVAWHGLSVQRAELLRGDEPPLPLAPEAGTRAARREAFAREHPALWSAQHVVAGVGKVVLPLLLGFLALRLLPDLDLNLDLDIDIPLPSIDLPDVPWPSIELPGWVKTVLETAKLWAPILGGIALAIAEYRRRRRERDATR